MYKTAVEQCCLVFGESENRREVSYDDYNPDNIVFQPVEANIREGDGFTVVTVPVLYRCPDGKMRGMNFTGAPQILERGVSESHKMGTKDEDKCTDTLTGYQVAYNVYADPKNPTSEEKIVKRVFDDICNRGKKHLKKIIEEDGDEAEHIPGNLPPLINTPEGGFKPSYAYPKKKDAKNPKKKVSDTDRSPVSYIKLKSFGEGHGIKVSSKLYVRGGEKTVPIPEPPVDDNPEVERKRVRCIGVRGRIEPIFSVKGLFLGAHGSTPYGASAQIKLQEGNWFPLESAGIPRMIRRVAVNPDETAHGSDDDDVVGISSSVGKSQGNINDWDDNDEKKVNKLKNIPTTTKTPAKVDDEDDDEDDDEAVPAPRKPAPKPKPSAKKPAGKSNLKN